MNVRETLFSLKDFANSQRSNILAFTEIAEKKTKLRIQYWFISMND